MQIVGEIGRGRFGAVYRAIDPRLDREVALKLLHVLEPAQHHQATAVIKEGRVLAQIRHTNVVTVFGADYFDERVGLWMEFIKGQTLKQIQQEQGPCSAQEAALIGLNLCLALAAVHRAGVLHRDIKAQNVMREIGGRIVLMDFGASEWFGPGTPSSMPLKGTPLYLAPELLDGHEATAGSDIYALGVLLYHLVTGRYPYEAPDLDTLRRAHRLGRTTRLHDIRPDLPDGFVGTIECALDPERKRRFGSAGSMQFALAEAFGLRFLAEASDASTRAAVAETTSGANTTPSIAVLPFSDMSPEHDQEYFCEGIAEELINALSTLTGVRVTARSSSFQFSGHAQDIRKVGELLNVQHGVGRERQESGHSYSDHGSVDRRGRRLPFVVRAIRQGSRRCVHGAGRDRPGNCREAESQTRRRVLSTAGQATYRRSGGVQPVSSGSLLLVPTVRELHAAGNRLLRADHRP